MKKTVLVVVLILIVAAGASYGGYKWALKKSQEKIKVLENALRMFYPETPSEMNSISGAIKEIKDDTIALETRKIFTDLYDRITRANETDIRTIKITKDTKIVEINFLAPVKIKPGALPSAPAEKPLKLSDLKVGDQITVSAKENVKDKMEFDAEKIILNFRMPMLPPATPPTK